MTTKAKREGPLKVPFEFDDAIKRALKVKPPPNGWRGLDQEAKHKPKPATTVKGKRKATG